MKAVYDEIGGSYSVMRRTDPRIAGRLYAELQGATRVVNIGAGAGSYEPGHVALVAIEPSWTMIAQREPSAHPVVQASAERLPLADNSFSHAQTVLSMHHWQDRARAFAEIKRVATDRFVAITWNPRAGPFWLTRDYFPEIHAADIRLFPDPDELRAHFDDVRISSLPIPDDCQDGLFAAFWKRPKAYLSSDVRRAMSPFASVTNLSEGLARLRRDLTSGAWERNNRAILELSALDVGYCLVSAKIRKSSRPEAVSGCRQ